MADSSLYRDLGYGISCIDTLLYRPGLAACYLIEQNGIVGFIDTGTNNSLPILQQALTRKNLSAEDVAFIMPTHVHLDHAGGVGGLMQSMPNAQLVIHPRGARHMIDPAKLEQGAIAVYGEAAFKKTYGELICVDANRVIEADDGFELDLNGRKLVFLDTPGHAKHHYCIYDEKSRGLFTGDTFGASYPELNYGRDRFIFPPTTPIQFDPQTWLITVQRLMAFKPNRIFLTHFGMHENVKSLAELLGQFIEEYVDIALEYEMQQNRMEKINKALMQTSINYLLDKQCGKNTDEIKALLKGDMQINAQGLDYWLTQRKSNG